MIAGTELLTRIVSSITIKIESVEYHSLSTIVPTSIFFLFAINLIISKLVELK